VLPHLAGHLDGRRDPAARPGPDGRPDGQGQLRGTRLLAGRARPADSVGDPELLRGFALLARAAGTLGQIAEERRPIGMDAYLTIDRNAVYVDPMTYGNTFDGDPYHPA